MRLIASPASTVLLLAHPTAATTLTCHAQNSTFTVQFTVPAKIGGKPRIEYDYPVDMMEFSFRNRNLVLVAMDNAEKSRLRIRFFAQATRYHTTYSGQVYADEGGMDAAINNGPVTCKPTR